ncbi:MAG: acetyltransferase [Osedax symbiont Rs2]|nr:MAG: acetyltransferase [Osedax symbiont Rs2]
MDHCRYPESTVQLYSTRGADEEDSEFLFHLKKSAEYAAVKAVFGWDEALQRKLHNVEFAQKRPTIVEVKGQRVGSYLLQEKGNHLYFCRFFLLPEHQGKGIGSKILQQCTNLADKDSRLVKLCYLQGNHVAGLYRRFDFKVSHENSEFVYMSRQPNPDDRQS